MSLMPNGGPGFLPLALILFFPLVLFTLVAVPSYFTLESRCSTLGAMMLAVLFYVRCPSRTSPLEFVMFRLPIITLTMTNSLMIARPKSTFLALLFWLVILTLFLILPLTVLVLIHLTFPVKVLPISVMFLTLVVFLTSGATGTLPPLVSLGLSGTAPWPLVLTFLVSPTFGSPRYSLVTSFPALSLTIMMFYCVYLSMMLFLLGQVSGSSILLFLLTMITTTLLLMPGLIGVLIPIVSLRLPNGGMRERV